MSEDSQIREVIQTYFECMFESSAEKAHLAFHAHAKITGFTPAGLVEMSVNDFAGFVASQPSGAELGQTPYLEILSLDIAGETAIARVRDDYLQDRYLDTLSFLREGGRWSIYNKLFHIEGSAGG
ncbi:MAG: nuclear transport factor 2 family protein [Pseudomonadota bacterium]